MFFDLYFRGYIFRSRVHYRRRIVTAPQLSQFRSDVRRYNNLPILYPCTYVGNNITRSTRRIKNKTNSCFFFFIYFYYFFFKLVFHTGPAPFSFRTASVAHGETGRGTETSGSLADARARQSRTGPRVSPANWLHFDCRPARLGSLSRHGHIRRPFFFIVFGLQIDDGPR